MIRSYLIEGLDRLGKSTLIEGIQHIDGFHQVIHYEKPKKLDYYQDSEIPLKSYQFDSFVAMFDLLGSHAPLIMDRAHLGECVYAPMYRKYAGDYVFQIEESFGVDEWDHIRLILLTEDFSISKHFVDDGLSLGGVEKREQEQNLFIEAFNKSLIRYKRIICVTDPVTGQFKSKEQILTEAML